MWLPKKQRGGETSPWRLQFDFEMNWMESNDNFELNTTEMSDRNV